MLQHIGVILMLGSVIAFSVMNLFVKLATTGIPAAEVAFFRFCVGILFVAVLTAISAFFRQIGRTSTCAVCPTIRKPGWLAARGILGSISILLLYLAYSRGSMTNVSILGNATPIFATLFSALILNERMTSKVVSSLTFSVIGVILILNGLSGFQQLSIGDLLSLASSFVGGMAIIAIRVLRKTESTWSIFTSLCLCGMVVTWLYGHNTFVIPTGMLLFYTLLAAILSTAGQLLMTASYRYLSVAAGSILSMATVLISAMLGFIVMGDHLNIMQIIGSVLLIGGCVAISTGPDQSSQSQLAERSIPC